MADDALVAVDLICPFCGYNLRGTPGGRCSECGKEFDRATMAESQIPWSHRRKIGRVRAFVKTCWMVTWRPGKLAEEMNRPVSVKDAMGFRRVVVGLICLPGWAGLTIAMVDIRREWVTEWGLRDFLTVVPPPWAGILWMILAGIFWWGVSGAVSLFVRARGMDKERQQKAVALSYYLGATWLMLYPTLAIFWCMLLSRLVDDRPWILGVCFGLAHAAAGLMAAWRICWVPLAFIKKVTYCGAGRMMWAMVGLPLCMVGMGFVVWTILMLAILVDVIRGSLR